MALPVNAGLASVAYPERLGIRSVVATVRLPILTVPLNVCVVAEYVRVPPPLVFATPLVHAIQPS